MSGFPLALLALGGLAYVAYRRRLDPNWTPLPAYPPVTGPSGGLSNSLLAQNVSALTPNFGNAGANVPTTVVQTSSQLGIYPATPTPTWRPNQYDGATWAVRPGDVSAWGNEEQRAGLPDRPLSELPAALMTAAGVVNPGLGTIVGLGTMITTGQRMSLGGIINSVTGMFSSSPAQIDDPTLIEGTELDNIDLASFGDYAGIEGEGGGGDIMGGGDGGDGGDADIAGGGGG
jgi:hypothetical protein